MPRFSERTLALVRRNVNDMLTQTCQIERQAFAEGSMGERKHGTEVIAADVACRVIRLTKRSTTGTENVGSQEALVERYKLITPVGTAFDKDDQIVMSSGEVYQVVDVEDKLTDEAFAGAMIVRVR